MPNGPPTLAFDYGQAIDIARNQNVDILNVSYGQFMPGCHGDCHFCYATERAFEDDITVVTAAGNRQENKPSVFCPAIKEDVISVGGMIARCTNEAGGISKGAYRLPELETPEDRIYCGQQGCDNGVDGICIHHLTEQPWDGNPSPVGDKPDVLAPNHIILSNENGRPKTEIGTSYAAPLVTSSLAIAYSKVAENDFPLPNPYQARQAVQGSGLSIYDTTIPKLDAHQLSLKLREKMAEQSEND